MNTHVKANAEEGAPEVITSIRLSRAQHEALKALAAKEHRNVSQQVRHLVERETARLNSAGEAA